MYYCQECRMLCDEEICPECKQKCVTPQPDDPCFLIEKQELWANMLKEMLEKHHIPYYCNNQMGAGMALKVGPMFESYQFYVPYSSYQQAQSCLKTLFSND